MDRLYRRTGFASERERVEHLFILYEQMHAPLVVAGEKKAGKEKESQPQGSKPDANDNAA